MKLSNFMSSTTQTISSAIENSDFLEVYNSFPIWLEKNMWAWKTGKQPATTPPHLATRINGITAFAKAHYNFRTEDQLKKFQRDASNYLSKNPEIMQEKADIFCQMFPAVIPFKLDKKQKADSKEDKVRDANLCSQFDIAEEVQMEIPLKITTAKSTKSTKSNSKLSEITQSICEMAKFGAKSIKSPDGWQVQF